MPLVRRIRKRNAHMVVEAHGEVLFSATGDVGRWTNRFSNRVRSFTAREAPSNERPRWAHYGKALRTTFTASTTYQPGRMRVYSAIGSTAPHAAFVDQGTGTFVGRSPWQAKILPPREVGGGDLYEHTFRPGGPGGKKVKPVYIHGQPGQFFFDKGLRLGFQSMRMRDFQVPGEGGPKIGRAINSAPPSLLGRVLGPMQTPAFMAQLDEWRRWRTEAYERGEFLTEKDRVKPTKPAKPPKKPSKSGYGSVAEKKEAALAQFRVQNPTVRIIRVAALGVVVQTPRGPYLISWSRLYDLLP